jgi:hypothetical protein
MSRMATPIDARRQLIRLSKFNPYPLHMTGEARLIHNETTIGYYPCCSVMFRARGKENHEVILRFDGAVAEKNITLSAHLCVVLDWPCPLGTGESLRIHMPGEVIEISGIIVRMKIHAFNVEWRTRGSNVACGYIVASA